MSSEKNKERKNALHLWAGVIIDGNGICQNHLQPGVLKFCQMLRGNAAVGDKKIDAADRCGGKIEKLSNFGAVSGNDAFSTAALEHFLVDHGLHIIG